MSSLESVWENREEVIYPTLFGEKRRGIFVLSGELFTGVFGQETYDPRWLHLGIFEFEPMPTRSTWLYVTSGGSTPWETEPSEYKEQEYSWLGVELVLEAKEQSEWAIIALQRLLAYNVLACHGRLGNSPALDYGHRIPLGGSIVIGKNSEISNVIIGQPTHFQNSAQLESGKFDFLQVVGVTEQERDYAKLTSTESLIEILTAKSAYPVTDPNRPSVLP